MSLCEKKIPDATKCKLDDRTSLILILICIKKNKREINKKYLKAKAATNCASPRGR